MNRKTVWISLALITVSAVGGYLAAKSAPNVLAENQAIESSLTEARIGPGCVIQKDVKYSLCGHTLQIDLEAERDLIGLSEAEYLKRYPEEKIDEFDNAKLCTSVVYEGYCPRHVILRLENGKLILFRRVEGTDEEKALYVYNVDSISTIPLQERNALRAGKVFSDMDSAMGYARSLLLQIY